ncbi:patched domain-containing protein 3-like [Chanos chanos]|uniref:Patched domain-containing protein 3 n=1 Tax=Chanos chanos TaxID=29144 RepID=A0A6J2UWI7_CHACN|nr:patched domain-containing protein 3-like [Chanos chanos]
MACYPTDCIEKPLSKLFGKLGHLVGSHPVWFLIIPLLVSIPLGGGFYFLKEREDSDIERQFTPVNGVSKEARQFVKENFPYNDSVFSSQRLHSEGNYAVMIVVANSQTNILTKASFEEVIRLNNKINSIAVKVKEKQLDFQNLCAKVNGNCVSNVILDIIENNPGRIEKTNLTFPLHTLGKKSVFLGSVIGGVAQSRGIVQRAAAVRLFYFLDNSSDVDPWLREFHKTVSTETINNGLKVSHFTSLSREEEIQKHTTDGIPYFSITYVLVILFSVISCMRLDNVRSKVWVAFIGVLSAGLAVLSSFGLLLYLGVPFVITVVNSPFLILGIGVDDMFIMISHWQETKVRDPVEKRMADTYKEAAISITITTLTDVLGFCIGLLSEFRAVQAFCLYSSAAIIFCYIYNITFFGAFLALNGKREASNRHWLTCLKVPSQRPEEKSKGYSLCCVGGDYDRETGTEVEWPINHFFKTYYGPFLTKPWTKVCVVLLYAGYLAVGIYGCYYLQQGIEMRNLAADDSYVIDYYDDERKYFSSYGPNVMVIVTEEFPYWDKNRRSELDVCMEGLNNLSFVDKELFTSWLDSYVTYANTTTFNLNDEAIFKANLSSFFKFFPEFRLDVDITEGEIQASRFFIQTVDIANASMEMKMFNELRNTAESCQVAKLMVYHPTFILYDQYTVIVSSTIQNVAVTTAVMLLISLLLIPNPLCSLWVTFSIGSVIVGVTGFMSLWDVKLDIVSMIILVVCIGFTVDFSAHISYSFVSSKKSTANEKAIDALFSLGYPILQGALSTIIGVVVLAFSKNHIYRTFFKIMLFVMLFGLIHGIVFIPMFLTFFSFKTSKDKGKPNKQECSSVIVPNAFSNALSYEEHMQLLTPLAGKLLAGALSPGAVRTW